MKFESYGTTRRGNKNEGENKNKATFRRSVRYALVGIGVAFVGLQIGTGADADQKLYPDASVDANRDLCELVVGDAFFRSFDENDRDSLRMSRETGNCEEFRFEDGHLLTKDERELEADIRALVAGYPIEAMLPYIVRYDREVAALLIGIAKKESDWGRRVPRDIADSDCFNYWGFKAAGTRGIAMGHGCFGSPEEAIARVGGRIAALAAARSSDPAKMVIWKCGSSCAWDDPANVRKWIADVGIYYKKIARM